MQKLQPHPKKSHPLFLTNPPLKVEVLSSPLLFENIVGGSTPPHPQKSGGEEEGAHYVKMEINVINNKNFTKFYLKIRVTGKEISKYIIF